MYKLTNQLACSLLTILMPISLTFASAPDTLWTKIIGGSGNQLAYSVFPNSDGGFMIGGYATNSGYADFYMVKTDDDGEIVWTKYFGEDDRYEAANWMIKTTDGGYMMAGGRAQDWPNSSSTDIYLIKTDENGDEQWSSIIGYDSISESANCIVQTSDGGYIMCGSYWASSQTGFDVLLVKTTDLGLEEWRQVISFEDGMAEYGMGVEQATDGGYLVTGKTQAFSGDYTDNAFILKTNMIGEMEWLQTYGGSWPWYENAYHIIHTSDGGYFLSGNQNNDGLDNNWFVVKTNGDGDQLWSDNSIGGIYHDKAYFACETFDGGYAVTGTFHQDVWYSFITKYNTDGDTLWTKMWGAGDDVSQHNYAIQQLEDGGYITVGSITFNGTEYDIYLTRLSPETVGINNADVVNSRKDIELFKNYPNPFNSSTIITYHLSVAQHVNITIFNVFGQKVAEIENNYKVPGSHDIEFEGKNFRKGIYYCILSSGDQILTTKLVYQ